MDEQWAASPQPLPNPYGAGIAPVRVPIPYYAPYPYALAAAPAQAAIPPRPQWQLPSSRPGADPDFYTPIRPIDQWEVSNLASFPERRSSPAPVVLTGPPAEKQLDRLQMTSWAMLRGNPSPGALAAGGTLGGSQAGARLTYAFNPGSPPRFGRRARSEARAAPRSPAASG